MSYRKQPLKPDWFTVFIDAYWEKSKTQSPDLERSLSLRGSKTFWTEILQDLINQGLKSPSFS